MACSATILFHGLIKYSTYKVQSCVLVPYNIKEPNNSFIKAHHQTGDGEYSALPMPGDTYVETWEGGPLGSSPVMGSAREPKRLPILRSFSTA